MTDNPATFIARRWYHDLDLTYAGVNFGEVLQYDVLQVINRSILREQEKQQSLSDQLQSPPEHDDGDKAE